jgi:hypothetical protein
MAAACKYNPADRVRSLIMAQIREICKSLALAAEKLEKLEAEQALTRALVDALKRDLIVRAGRVNEYADNKDLKYNLVNYGEVLQIISILNPLKIDADFQVWGDGDYYRIPKVTIDGKETVYPASDKGAAA